jgi:hypothetical protein
VEVFGSGSTVYYLLTSIFYLVLMVLLFFNVKSKLRDVVVLGFSKLLIRIRKNIGISNVIRIFNNAIIKPIANWTKTAINYISRNSGLINFPEKLISRFEKPVFTWSFDITALVLRKFYSPEPQVVLTYTLISIVAFYFILTIS